MSNQFTPILKPDAVTINLNKGVKGMFAGLVKMLPHGETVLSGGLKQVIDRMVDENPQLVDREFTAVDLAEHLGILKKQPKRRRRA